MSKRLSVAEVQGALSECIREVTQGETVLIKIGDRPIAALVRPEDLEQLQRIRDAGAEAGLASLVGGWEDSEELTHHLGQARRSS